MFDSFIVELVIGTLTLFALLGIIVTTLTEAFQTFVQKSVQNTCVNICGNCFLLPKTIWQRKMRHRIRIIFAMRF